VPDDAVAEFAQRFRLPELTVHEGVHWVMSVRPAQPVLGALVLSTRHRALDFSSVPADAGPEMLHLMGVAERTARERFGAVRVNALCLMMRDPLVHFHLLPRYGESAELAGRTRTDPGWPGPPALGEDQAGAGDLDELVRLYRGLDWS
jgi:diadenosine tetraphosphate (Ap4A) HIT family hydrolase